MRRVRRTLIDFSCELFYRLKTAESLMDMHQWHVYEITQSQAPRLRLVQEHPELLAM